MGQSKGREGGLTRPGGGAELQGRRLGLWRAWTRKRLEPRV